jgi:AraC-like DNA-binding protein
LRKGKDIAARFPGLYVVHQNIPGKHARDLEFLEHILFVPLRGEIRLETEKGALRAAPGEMLFLPGSTIHSFVASPEGGERLIAMITPHKPARAPLPVTLPINQLLKELLFYLLLHPATENAVSLVSVFRETLAETLAGAPAGGLDHRTGRVKDPRVKKALELLRRSLTAPDMDKIATAAALSPRTLQRLLVQETGLSPKQWTMHFRVEAAKALLKKPGASVTDAAFAVGYRSLSQFIAAFRAQTGQLPSEYLRHG